MEHEVFSMKEKILADTLSPADLKETIENIAEEVLEAQVKMVYKNAKATKWQDEENSRRNSKGFLLGEDCKICY